LTAPTATVRTTSDGANKRARVSTFADLLDDPAAPSTSASSSSSARMATLASLPNASSFSSSSSSGKSSQRFWDGAIKRVPNVYHPDSDSWSFSDLIGPSSTLDAAIVSAFCLDPEWVVPQFPHGTPLLLVMPRPTGDNVPNPAQCDLKPSTYRVCPPHLAPGDYGVMHIKFQVRLLLFNSLLLPGELTLSSQVFYHSTFIRIVIPTANAVPYDYESMDNALYIHDFPLQSNPVGDVSDSTEAASPFKNPTHTQFSKTFFQVAYKLAVPKKFLSFSTRYDFSHSKDVRLVQSLQGAPRTLSPCFHPETDPRLSYRIALFRLARRWSSRSEGRRRHRRTRQRRSVAQLLSGWKVGDRGYSAYPFHSFSVTY
jgi:tyrosyl-DNA phosphodiesterase-1